MSLDYEWPWIDKELLSLVTDLLREAKGTEAEAAACAVVQLYAFPPRIVVDDKTDNKREATTYP